MESGQQEGSASIRNRVINARKKQMMRSGITNAKMKPGHLKQHCKLAGIDQQLLYKAIEQFGLSSRAHNRILRVSRTIADLDLSDNIETHHLTEAINYRRYFNQAA
jgi:magnesium chelatase family protein